MPASWNERVDGNDLFAIDQPQHHRWSVFIID